MDLDSAADELYGLAPEEFVGRRTALEKQARADDDRTLAGQIHRLTRPTRSAWLVNLLSREHPETVEELLDLADLLAEGMRTLSAPELQQLTRQRTRLVSSIGRTALAVGREHGHRASEATRAEVDGTLTAALADPEIAEEVRAGRLARAVTWSGFGLPGSPDAPATPSRRPGAKASTGPKVGTSGAEQGRAKGKVRSGDPEMASVVELAPHRREAERTRARKRSKRADDEHRRAAAAVDRSATRVTEAEERTTEARRVAEPVREDVRTAEDTLAEAERAVQRARREHERVSGIADRAAEKLADAVARLRQLREEDGRARTRLTEAENEVAAAEEALSALDDDDR